MNDLTAALATPSAPAFPQMRPTASRLCVFAPLPCSAWGGTNLENPRCHISREKHDPKGFRHPMFTAAPFTMAKTWKRPRCPLREEWLMKMWSIDTVEY